MRQPPILNKSSIKSPFHNKSPIISRKILQSIRNPQSHNPQCHVTSRVSNPAATSSSNALQTLSGISCGI